MEKLKITRAVIVEGRYDKIKLDSIIDALIIPTDGFGVFKSDEKKHLLTRLAKEKGLIVLTDSDGAGLVIRNRIRSSIDPKYVKHAYIPDIKGKERRKTQASKEGTLGVEGMDKETLLEALRRCGATEGGEEREYITKADLFAAGLSGGAGSAAKRKSLQKKLRLPEKLSPNALLDVLNALMSRDEFLSAAASLLKDGGEDNSQ